jgi:hypothetical protein
VNFGNCKAADDGTRFDVADGADLKCPECGEELLVPQHKGSSRTLIIGGVGVGMAVVVVAAGLLVLAATGAVAAAVYMSARSDAIGSASSIDVSAPETQAVSLDEVTSAAEEAQPVEVAREPYATRDRVETREVAEVLGETGAESAVAEVAEADTAGEEDEETAGEEDEDDGTHSGGGSSGSSGRGDTRRGDVQRGGDSTRVATPHKGDSGSHKGDSGSKKAH